MTNDKPKFHDGDPVIFTLDDGVERRGYFDSYSPFSDSCIIRASKSKKSGQWRAHKNNVRHANDS